MATLNQVLEKAISEIEKDITNISNFWNEKDDKDYIGDVTTKVKFAQSIGLITPFRAIEFLDVLRWEKHCSFERESNGCAPPLNKAPDNVQAYFQRQKTPAIKGLGINFS